MKSLIFLQLSELPRKRQCYFVSNMQVQIFSTSKIKESRVSSVCDKTFLNIMYTYQEKYNWKKYRYGAVIIFLFFYTQSHRHLNIKCRPIISDKALEIYFFSVCALFWSFGCVTHHQRAQMYKGGLLRYPHRSESLQG